jgi:hypothetical protein
MCEIEEKMMDDNSNDKKLHIYCFICYVVYSALMFIFSMVYFRSFNLQGGETGLAFLFWIYAVLLLYALCLLINLIVIHSNSKFSIRLNLLSFFVYSSIHLILVFYVAFKLPHGENNVVWIFCFLLILICTNVLFRFSLREMKKTKC